MWPTAPSGCLHLATSVTSSCALPMRISAPCASTPAICLYSATTAVLPRRVIRLSVIGGETTETDALHAADVIVSAWRSVRDGAE